MIIALAAALPIETFTLRRLLGKAELLPLSSGRACIWNLSHNRVILLETGLGMIKTAQTLNALLQDWQLDALLNFGTAGGLDHKLKVGDLFLPNEVIRAADGELVRLPTRLTALLYELSKREGHDCTLGRLTTVDRAVGSQAQRTELASRLQAQTVDMEAFALAQLAEQRHIPFASLKFISDRANLFSRFSFWRTLLQANRLLGKLMERAARSLTQETVT